MGKGAAQVVIALLLFGAALSPLALSVDGEGQVVAPGPGGSEVGVGVSPEPDFVEWKGPTDGTVEGSSPAPVAEDGGDFDSVEEEVRVIAEVGENAEIPEYVRRQYGDVYTREGARRINGTLSLSEVRALSRTPGIEGVRIQGEPELAREPGRSPPGVETVGATALHERGIDGDGVVVGIIDSGFRLSHPSVADNLEAYRSFSGSAVHDHGTAVASVVADTAPGARLHLAAIGPTTSPSEYRAAVEWLRESGADVIVDAGSYFGQPGDGSGPIAEVAANASEEVVFVTSAGNYARRHWAGVHRPATDSGYVDLVPGVEANPIGNGTPVSGRIEVALTWNGSADYDLYLVRDSDARDMVIASTSGTETDGPHDYLSVVVPEGRYYVAVHPNDTNATLRPHRLELFASHDLRYRTESGSLTAPATAEGVLAVGAYANGTVEPFSSRGPTDDGRRGVDLVAPDGVRVDGVETGAGTSFAAPYVAGTVALLMDAHPELSSDRIERIVRLTAEDVATLGPDPATGYGLIDAGEALGNVDHSVAEAETSETVNGTSNGTAGDPFEGSGWRPATRSTATG